MKGTLAMLLLHCERDPAAIYRIVHEETHLNEMCKTISEFLVLENSHCDCGYLNKLQYIE